MILETRPRLAALREFAADVHVIGSGSVGIVTALALADRGFRVLVLESGGAGPEPAADDLAVAESLSPDNHFEPHTAVARRLGGTSNLWAGRCVPFDPIDFRARPWLGLDGLADRTEADLAPYLAPALDALGAGAAVFDAPLPGVAADPAFRCDTLERWSNVPRIQKRHARGARRARATSWSRCARRSPASATARTAAIAGARARTSRGRAGRRSPPPASSSPPAATPAPGCSCSSRSASRRASAAPAGRSGASTWGISAARSPTSSSRARPLHDALDYHVDAHGSYVRRRLVPAEATKAAEAPRQRRLLAGGAADRRTPRTARDRSRRSSSRCRSRRSAGG